MPQYAALTYTADVDWSAPQYADVIKEYTVISWYDVLLTVQDTGVVRLNRAAAVAERDGPAAGLALVDAIEDLGAYPWRHASRAELEPPG